MRVNARLTLTQKLMLYTQSVFVGLTLLTSAVMGYLVYVDSKAQLIHEQTLLNQQLAQRIDQELRDRRNTLMPLADQLHDGQGLKSLPAMQAVLDSRIKLHDFFNAGLVIADAQGNLLVDSPTVPGRVGLNISDRPHFKALAQEKSPIITSAFIGRAVKAPVFHIYVPIFNDQGQRLGYVFGVTKLEQDNFLRSLSQAMMEAGSHFYVLDMNQSLVINATRPNLIKKDFDMFSESQVLAQIQQGQRNGTARSQFGGDVLYTAQQLEAIDWMVVHTTQKAQILEPVWSLLTTLSWLIFGLLLAVVALSIWFIRRTLAPLSLSAKKAERMVSGEQSTQKFTITCQDELGGFLQAFNRLLAKQEATMQDLRLAKQHSDQANVAKSQFLANMSHEIRTPLNAVIGLTELLLNDKSLSKKAAHRIEQVYGSGRLLLGVINDILDYSKIESGRLELESAPFKLNAILEQLSVLFGNRASEKNIELIFHVHPDVPTAFVGDSLRLTQVLTNLINNAIKFTETGEIELYIRTEKIEGNQAHLVFAVRDTGIGMSEKEQKRLFHAFSQADTSITRKHGGSGLGLVISQRLVSLMGGDPIQVDSRPDQGSVFSFALTLSTEGQPHRNAHHFECDPAPCRALVVDDQPTTRTILQEILQSWDFEVDLATDGQQAVEKVQAHMDQSRFYRAILMDWEMPHLNGLQALRQIKDLYTQSGHAADLPALLMISAHSESEIDMHSSDQFSFLHKPFSPSHLYNAISSLGQLETLGVASEQRQIIFPNAKLLVVEDNAINRSVIIEILKTLGIEADVAEDGIEAVEAVKTQSYTLVLMDMQMPRLDGYQATRNIRKFNTQLPIVALTAAAMVEDRQKALDAGMDAHLAKPIDQSELKRVLMNFLAWSETIEAPTPIQSDAKPMQKEVDKAAEKMLESPGQTEVDEQTQAVLAHSKPTLLIVDDEPANIKILANGLKHDYRIMVANTGQKALALAESEHQPDLILLDIMMPDMDGYQVCRQLKESPKTQFIPVIFVSALDHNSEEEKGLNLGAVDYISKPFHLPIVQSRVRNHLALKLKTDLLEQMSHMDGLTHVANRRQFDETLCKEAKRLVRSHEPLGLIMIDIDFFKPFNDHYGHGQGDMCLQKVADALQSVIKRPGDLLARYGGEEFVVLLPETPATGTQEVAETLRATVAALKLTHEYSEISDTITISVGAVASDIQTVEQANELLIEADDALYQAKKKGRNQVYLAQPKRNPI